MMGTRDPRRPDQPLDAAVADTFPASDPATTHPHTPTDREIDAAVADTFPASDPPSMSQPVTAAPAVDTEHGTPATTRQVFRVTTRDDVDRAFVAEANLKEGRWSREGTPAVYASLSAAGAFLEFLAHLEGDSPEDLVVVTAVLPAGSVVQARDLPPAWRERPYRAEVQDYGNRWIASGEALALELPSVLCEVEHNVLINPRHPDADRLKIRAVDPIHVDPRLRY